MTFTIKGYVKAIRNDYFTCLKLDGLSILINEAPFGSTPSNIDSATINNDGYFEKEVTSSAKAFQLQLYKGGGGGGLGTVIGESPKFCPHDNLIVYVPVDEAADGDPIYDIILERVNEIGVTDAEMIMALTAEELVEIECNICVAKPVLKRFQNAYLLWNEFSTMTRPDAYSETETPWNDFISDPDSATADERGRRIFFALLKSNPGDSVHNMARIEASGDTALGGATVTVSGAYDETMNGEYTGTLDGLSNELNVANANWSITLTDFQDGHDASGTFKNSLAEVVATIPEFPVSGSGTITGNGLINFAGGENVIKNLLTNSRDQFADKIHSLGEMNEIDEDMDSSTNLDYLEASRDALLLNAEHDGAYYDAKIIHLSDNTYSEKSDLLDSALANGGLLGIPASEPPDPTLEEAQKIHTISEVLLNFAPFLEAFIDDRGDDIDYFELASDGPGDLETLITSSGALHPDYLTAAEYAEAIYAPLGEGQPSARMAYALDAAGAAIPSGGDIITLLEANQDFNVREHSAATFFTTEIGQPNTISETLMEDLLTVQRTSNLTGDKDNLDNSAMLIDLELTSSSAIIHMGEATFLDTLGGLGTVSPDTATAIFSRARSIHETASFMALNYLRYEGPSALMPRSLRTNDLSLPGGALPENLPNMQDLFGSLDTCTCEHCQSVYSAAAYLTDLLNWLRKDVVNPANTSQTGFAALETLGGFDRRKDIRYLLLTCKNTNTLLPYIDIVNEILSVELLADVPSPTYTSTDIMNARKSLQTTKTAEEIRIEPEHRFHDAELLLKDYFYTWKLPYDVAFDEVLSYTGVSGSQYHEVVTSFSSPTQKYDHIRWALTVLNINPNELTMYTGSNSGSGTFWIDYWGASSAITTLGPVLKTTGLTVAQLKEELNAYYINGTSLIEVGPDEDLCDVDTYIFNTTFTAAIAEKLMKFFRLRRRANLSVWEMDIAIGVLGAGTINDAFIQKLAAALQFTKAHNVSFGDLMILMVVSTFEDKPYIDQVTTSDFTEYYNDRFLNPLLPQVVKDFFATAPFAPDVDDLSNEEKQFLATTMGTDIHTINAVISYSGLTGSFTTIKLAKLHRLVLLLKVFDLDHSELSDSITFFGDIFAASNKIKEAWNFSEKLSRFRTIDVPLLEFKDIANGTGDYTLAALDPKAEKSWIATEKAFQEAIKANPDKDPTDITYYDFYRDVVVRDLALQFNLLEEDVLNIITEYSGTWISDFIDVNATRTWANLDTMFAPVHRLLNRIVLLSDIVGMEKVTDEDDLERQSLSYAIEVEIDASKDVPGTSPFYWMKNDYTALTAGSLSEIVWIKFASRQAELLDMAQRDPSNTTPPIEDLYVLIDDYINNATYYSSTNTPPYQGIFDIYESLGDNSAYKKLTIHEFTEIFRRARSIVADTTDIVSIFDSFERIYKVTRTFNIKVADAWGWVWTDAWETNTFTATTLDYDVSADIKRTLNAKYPVQSVWSKVIVPVQDGLRARMRDAFVGLYIAERGFENENEIYAFYLLDPLMAPCMDTSRIVQAIASCQLLVHRALLNLETTMFMDEKDKHEWQWRKNYRVWEAARKVFLYPENWIEPSLRGNKTELFKAAEELLQSDEITDKNSEKAYSDYLNGLNDVAHLDIRAVYVEDPAGNLSAGDGMKYTNNRDEIYHVFARNWNPPYIYYYRKFEDGVWKGWEKMDIEIDSDHLIPCMFNRKLYVFFPIFKDKIWDNKPENKYYEIHMAYTKYDFGKWSQKKIFKDALYATPVCFLHNASTPEINPEQFGEKFWDHEGWSAPDANGNWVYHSGRSDIKNNYYSSWLGSFSMVSMEKKDFYFWSENLPDGKLRIHVRRVFDTRPKKSLYTDDSYTEMAFELNYVINPADERVGFDGDPEYFLTPNNPRFYLARPYMTKAYYQQMIHGKTYPPATPTASPLKLFVKMSPTIDSSGCGPLLNNASNYILTFPQQYKHSIFKQPFFFKHPDRSYFFRSIWYKPTT